VFYISTKGKGKASGNAFTFHHTSLLYANYPLKVTTTGSAILYTIFFIYRSIIDRLASAAERIVQVQCRHQGNFNDMSIVRPI